MSTPFIHVQRDFLGIYDVETRTLKAAEIAVHFENLRVALKKAADYHNDSSNLIVEDTFGRAALKVTFDEDGSVSFWSARTGSSIGYIDCETIDKMRNDVGNTVADWADKAGDGMIRCNECHRWVNIYHSYSFAGAVCNDCYNPKKHLAPDTRGD